MMQPKGAAICALPDYADQNVKSHLGSLLGNSTNQCERCGAYNFEEERLGHDKHFSICCENGRISPQQMPRARKPPREILEILKGEKRIYRTAREMFKTYNNAFSFVSFGGGCFEMRKAFQGPPVVFCHGSVYHMSGSLFPDDPENALYAQVYLYDHNEAVRMRMQSTPFDLDEHIVSSLQTMMHRINPYVERYQDMKKMVEKNPAEEIQCRIVVKETTDPRTYNKPKVFEPAVIFESKDGVPKPNRDIVVWPHDPELKAYRISNQSMHVDPMAYPFLFPYGELGWGPTLKHEGERKTEKYTRLTGIEFWSYRLMIRDADVDESDPQMDPWPYDQISLPHSGGLLFQQWLCDIFSRTEAQRLAWVLTNQETLRADSYDSIREAVLDPAYKPGVTKIGKQIILPASFQGPS